MPLACVVLALALVLLLALALFLLQDAGNIQAL
jgi:hypothetical protein